MTAKRFIRKTFRKARHNVCKFIVGFDTCPTGCRKNYNDMVDNAVSAVLLCLVGVVFTVLCVMMV